MGRGDRQRGVAQVFACRGEPFFIGIQPRPRPQETPSPEQGRNQTHTPQGRGKRLHPYPIVVLFQEEQGKGGAWPLQRKKSL